MIHSNVPDPTPATPGPTFSDLLKEHGLQNGFSPKPAPPKLVTPAVTPESEEQHAANRAAYLERARESAERARERALDQAGYSDLGDFGVSDENICINWAVDGMIPEAGITGIYGRPGAYKSFLALHLAACISSGEPFLGHDTCTSRREDNERPPECFYHWGEGTADLHARVNEGLTDDQFTTSHGFRIRTKKGLDLSDREQVQALALLMRNWPVVVFDTIKDYVDGGYENYAAISRAFQNLIEWSEEWTACIILVAHSSSKGDGRSIVGTDEWLRSVDTQIKVTKDGPGGVITCDKIRQGPVFEPVSFRMKPTAHSLKVVAARPAKMERGQVIRHLITMHKAFPELSSYKIAEQAIDQLGTDIGYSPDYLRKLAGDVISGKITERARRTKGNVTALPTRRKGA